jgi:4'-phosphopantetheinyl transferase
VAVACAVSDRPVGIDIEHLRPFNKELATYVLNEDQLEQVLQSTDPAVEFLKFWTQKESLLKLTGEGIRNDLKTLDMHKAILHTTINIDGSYVCSSASFNPIY